MINPILAALQRLGEDKPDEGPALVGICAHCQREVYMGGAFLYGRNVYCATEGCATAAVYGERMRPSPIFLAFAEQLGAKISGKPDGSESITVVFTVPAWRLFDSHVAPVFAEYMKEYENGLVCAAAQIWASIYRHDGDPCWENRTDGWSINGEVRR